jgi:ribonuclease E
VPSAYLHPEFGYFCPSPKLRRRLWALLAFLVFGSIVGASGILSIAEHDHDAAALMVAHADDGPEAQAAAPGQAAAPARHPAAGGTTTIEKSAIARTAVEKAVAARETKSGAVKSEVARLDTGRPEAGKPDAAKPVCEETTWSYLDGKCISGNARKVRVVRVPTNRPAIAAVAIGRTAAPAPAANPAAPAANAAENRKSEPSPSKAAQADATVAAAPTDTDPSQRPAAGSKKPQRAAQVRRHEPAPLVREVRAPAYGASPQGPIGFGFFSMFR